MVNIISMIKNVLMIKGLHSLLTDEQQHNIKIPFKKIGGIFNGKQPKEKKVKKALKKNKYNLLLTIPADKLKKGLAIDDEIDKSDVHKLLQFTKYAYCFVEDNAKGQTIIDNLKLSDEIIDISSSRNIFVQIKLEAFSGIENESFSVQIQGKIPDDTVAKVIQIKILQDARSAENFFELM